MKIACNTLRQNRILFIAFITHIFLIFALVSLAGAFDEDIIQLTVTKGDSLSNICKKYLNDETKWSVVARFNRFKNPDRIYPKQRIAIPARFFPSVPLDGQVTFVYGDARVQREEKGEWIPLSVGNRISQGNSVRTASASSAEITFDDRNSIFIRSNTTLGVTTAQKKGGTYTLLQFFLDIGRTLTKIKETTGTDSRIQINTPSAVASVRGTDFRVSADAASMRTEVLQGTVTVTALKKTVAVNKGEGTYVEKGTTPTAPRKLLPPPPPIDLKPIYKEMPLRFTFEGVPGASRLRAALARDRDGKEVVEEKVGTVSEPCEFIGLKDGMYYLFSTSLDDVGLEGPQSEPFPVKVRTNPLPPFIQQQTEDLEFIGKRADFTWLKVPDAVKYHLQLAEENTFAPLIDEKTDLTEVGYRTAVLDYKTYYMRIRSIAEDGYEGGWSQAIRFRLTPPPPSPPLDKPGVDDKGIRLTWRGLGEGITYHVQMAKDTEFTEVLVDKKVDKPEISIQKPEDPGLYHFRISSIDKKGREGEFSPPQSLEIKRPFPYGVLGVIGAVGLIIILIP